MAERRAVPPVPTVHLHELPAYVLDIDLDPDRRIVHVTQHVHWTNPGTAPTSELVFQVIPNNRPSKQVIETGSRTLESLRIDPRTALDERGRRFTLRHVSRGAVPLASCFSARDDTHLHVTLNEPVHPGESVSVELVYSVSIPQVMGRLGQYRCVTNLLNWYPVLAVYQCDAWQPVPYVPWHQSFYNEAGNYVVKLRVPQREVVVTGGHVTEESLLADGRKELAIEGRGLRDFTIICSRRFQEWRSEVNGIPLRVVAFPEHAEHAKRAMTTAAECIATYESWFGSYPYEEFELAESYFGWNGNESSGVVMIDQRIFDAPQYAGLYVEHLISHEICHQWWYSAVGTNGYAEPWLDEGLVQWFTRVRIEDKYGPDPLVLDLPSFGHLQLPNVRYRKLLHSGYDVYRLRGGAGTSGGSLEEMGNLHNLFSLVYDRGARITGMIQNRMGRQNFFAFMQHLFHKYQYRILTMADFQCELERWTGCNWDYFFETWLRSDGITDWKVEDVEVTKTPRGYRTEAHISQQGDIAEPVRIGLAASKTGSPFRYLTLNEAAAADEGVSIRRTSPTDWLVTVETQQKPRQLIVDPDMWGLEADRHNNTWKKVHSFRASLLYSPADEVPMVQPWQQDSIVGGFGVDSEARLGFRTGLVSANRFRVSPFVAYTASTARNNDDHLSAGVDGVVYNFPSPNWELRARYEHALLSTLANDPGHQARISLRHILQYTTSFIYPHLSYVDFYTRMGDNFFPDRDTTVSPNPLVQNYNDVRAFGVEFHVDSQMPYWNPDRGVRFDAGYEHGFAAFSRGASYDRLNAQASVVQRIDHGPCWLQKTKLAARVAGGYGWDNNGQHFRFGGPGRFRGVQAADVEGNAFWLTSLEWRVPLTGELDREVADNTASLQSVDGSLFYDVGRSYLFDQPQGDIDHAVGAGLYFEIPILSFVENLTIRTEYGYSLVNQTSAFWFGLYRAF
ncbi:MAG: M1 family aminopeptidase [Planctomycetaceae bacterium]